MRSMRSTIGSSSVFMNDLSFGEIQKRVAALPPASAIFFGDLIIDAQGVPYSQEEVLARLHAVANAPIFGQYDYQLGAGIVGGPLLSIRTLSRKTAEVAVQVLGGVSPGDIKTPPQKFGEPEFDWRELRRWGVAEASLPPNSTVSFREPTLWEQYRWYILAAAGVLRASRDSYRWSAAQPAVAAACACPAADK